MFEYLERKPLELHQIVRCVWLLRASVSSDATMPIVPDGSVEIVLNLGDLVHELAGGAGPSVQPRAMLVGQPTRPVIVRPTGIMHMVGIRLQPWASRSFMAEPAADLTNRSADVSATANGGFSTLLEQLAAAPTDAMRLDTTISWLRTRPFLPHARLTQGAVQIIRERSQLPSIRGMAAELGVTMRTVQRAFTHDVGLGPKMLHRISRLQRAIGISRAHPAMPWAAVAARVGYYDEAHLNLDFHALAGCAPSQFSPRAQSLTELMLESRAT